MTDNIDRKSKLYIRLNKEFEDMKKEIIKEDKDWKFYDLAVAYEIKEMFDNAEWESTDDILEKVEKDTLQHLTQWVGDRLSDCDNSLWSTIFDIINYS